MTSTKLAISEDIFFEGNEKVVIVFHSFTNKPKILWSLLTKLKMSGYTVYAPVLSGHHDTNIETLLHYDAKNWLQDGLDAVQLMRNKGYDKMAVFGLSIGGLVAVNALLNNPDLVAVGTMNSPVLVSPKGDQVGEAFMKTYQARLRLETELDEKEITEKQAEASGRLEAVLASMHQAAEAVQVDYPKIKKRVFIAQGQMDELIDNNIAFNFSQRLTNADQVILKWYPEGKHYLTLGKSGKQLSADVLVFLADLQW